MSVTFRSMARATSAISAGRSAPLVSPRGRVGFSAPPISTGSQPTVVAASRDCASASSSTCAARPEAAAAPDFAGTTRVHLQIEPTVAAELRALLAAGRLTVGAAVGVMEETYRRYVVDRVEVFAGIFQHVLRARERPVLFHCAAGKDRTGVAAALILTALGVRPAIVMEDYLLSNRLFRPTPGTADVPDDVREAIVKVRPSYLEAAFAAMAENWGGPDEYLDKALGIGARERDAIAEAFADATPA